MIGLGDLPTGGFSSGAVDVTADGKVAVGYAQVGNDRRAFVWDAANGMQDLDALLAGGGLLPTGWTTEYANAVTVAPDGLLTIAGSAVDATGAGRAFVAAIPVPEPASMLALALLRRKR